MSSKIFKDKTLELSFENFSKFTKVNNDNLSEFICNGSVFIVATVNNKEFRVEHTFSSRKPFKEGLNDYYYIYDNTILKYTFKCFKSENIDDFNDDFDNYMKYVDKQLILGKLYAIKI
jgi:hypothetical protein